MELWEVFLLGGALAMDAFAAGMTDGMAEPRMKGGKAALIAAVFGLFQFAMPLVGYYGSSLVSAVIGKIAPWLSFALLAFIGGKAIADCLLEKRRQREGQPTESKPLSFGKLFVQGVATSLDALAVGVTFLAVETENGLPVPAILCSVIIGAVTFALAALAVFLGKKIGDRFSDKARIAGGVILILIGVKILLEGIL